MRCCTGANPKCRIFGSIVIHDFFAVNKPTHIWHQAIDDFNNNKYILERFATRVCDQKCINDNQTQFSA